MISNIIVAAAELAKWLFLVAMILCIWETGKIFNEVPEKHKVKPVLAWDLFMLVVSLVIIVMNMAKG